MYKVASDLTSRIIVLRRIRRRLRETVAWVLNSHECVIDSVAESWKSMKRQTQLCEWVTQRRYRFNSLSTPLGGRLQQIGLEQLDKYFAQIEE